MITCRHALDRFATKVPLSIFRADFDDLVLDRLRASGAEIFGVISRPSLYQ
jgi:hypothetical protein